MKSLRLLIKYIHPFIKDLYPVIFFSAGLGVMSNIFAVAILPYSYQQIIDLIHQGDFSSIEVYTLAGYAVGVFLLISIGYRASDYLHTHWYSRVMSRCNLELFSVLMGKDFHFYQNNLSGSMVAQFTKFTRALITIYETISFGIIGTSAGLIGVFVVLIQESFWVAGIFFLWAVCYCLVSMFFARKRSHTSLVRSKSFSHLTGHLSDAVSGINQVKAMGQVSLEKKNFEAINSIFIKAYRKDGFIYDHGQSANNIVNIVLQASIVFIGLYLFLHQKISLGVVVLLLLYVRVLMARIRNLGKLLPNLFAALSDTQEIMEIINQKNKVVDNLVHEFIPGNHDIRFTNISFTYPNGDHVFENFNLDIPEGQSVGIVGKSGSGKTTLVKLLLRFYDPDAGIISVGGNNIRSLGQQSYRREILSFIPQETTLFHRSLRENIMYGNQNAPDKLFNQVVQDSYVDEFVSGLDDGYDTKVGERGIRLSGGQRQRVGIARAMMKTDAPILIMDEATSALDSQSEQYIQKSFEKLSEGRTTIVIAHRLSTIQKMDRIIVMDSGEIIEDGTHDELIKKDGHYSKLWNSQIGGFIQE